MDPLVSALIVQFICLAISEILPFLKNYPNGVVHTLVDFFCQHPTLVTQTLHETEESLRKAGNAGEAGLVEILEKSIQQQQQTSDTTTQNTVT